MKLARAWPRAGLCQRTACGFWPVRRRGDVAQRGAGRYQDGRVWRMTSSPIFRGMGTPCPANKPRTGTLPTRWLRRHKTGLSARQAGTRRWRGPSVAVRKTADGAHRPRRRPTPVRHASVDTATQRPAARQDDTTRDREETARLAENFQLAGRFRRWWQVLGSNQRRLSRRFYRLLLRTPPHRHGLHKRDQIGRAATTPYTICTWPRAAARPVLCTATYRTRRDAAVPNPQAAALGDPASVVAHLHGTAGWGLPGPLGARPAHRLRSRLGERGRAAVYLISTSCGPRRRELAVRLDCP